jgi:hypothetical protein
MLEKGPFRLVMTLFLQYPSAGALSQEQGRENYFEHIQWRHIGPAVFGGRVPDVEARRGQPSPRFGERRQDPQR